MNFLDIICTNLGVSLDGLDTDEKKMAAITSKLADVRTQAQAGAALMAKLNAKTADEAMAVLSTMVPREEHTKLQNEKSSLDLQLVLLEGQMSGKLSQADCDPAKGWAYSAAKQAPQVLRGMLSALPPKVATGAAVKAVVDGLQTKVHDGQTAATSITVNDHKYGLTDLTKGYNAAEMDNLRDMIGRFGVKAMVDQGYITEG